MATRDMSYTNLSSILVNLIIVPLCSMAKSEGLENTEIIKRPIGLVFVKLIVK